VFSGSAGLGDDLRKALPWKNSAKPPSKMKTIPARDPKQCGGEMGIMYHDVVDDDDE
jgi:hypothetical protein